MKLVSFFILGSLLASCASNPDTVPATVEAQEEEFYFSPEDYDYGPDYEGDGDYMDDNPYAYWY